MSSTFLKFAQLFLGWTQVDWSFGKVYEEKKSVPRILTRSKLSVSSLAECNILEYSQIEFHCSLAVECNMNEVWSQHDFLFLCLDLLPGCPRYFFLLLFFLFGHVKQLCILLSQAGIEPESPEVEVQSLNHWAAREFPKVIFLYLEVTGLGINFLGPSWVSFPFKT